MSEHSKGVLLAFVAVILWSWPGIILRGQSTNIDPSTLVWLRFTMAWVVLGGISLVRHRRNLKVLLPPDKWSAAKAMLAGLFLTCNYWLYNQGVLLTSASLGSILSQIGPVVLTLAGIFLLRERLSARQQIGLGVFLVGLVVFFLHHGHGFDSKPAPIGVLSLIVGALFWSFSTLLQKKIAPLFKQSVTVNLLMFPMATVALLPFVDRKAIGSFSEEQWLIVTFLGLSILGSWASYTRALQILPASVSGLLVASCPLVTLATLQAIVVFAPHLTFVPKEPLGALAYLGAFLLAVGLALILLPRQSALLRRPKAIST